MNEPSGEITSEFITQCLQANELGDAMIYIALNRGKRLYNKASNEWIRWAGHHWEIDQCSLDAISSVAEVSNEYLNEAKLLVDRIAAAESQEAKQTLIDRQKKIYNRVDRLRSVRGSTNCLTFTTRCHDRLVTTTELFDADPWKLPVINGVVDLKNGELYPGEPQQLLMKYCPHNWTGIETPCPIWEKSILEIMDENHEMVNFIQCLLGYAITGLTTEHILPIFYGKGRNGKTLIIETIRYVMGDMASPIRSELLLEQRFGKSSSGPTPEIMSLKGLRIAFASETDEGAKLSVSNAKKLTGGDTLLGRNPHDKYETKFNTTHTLFMLTNNIPSMPVDDFALWERIFLVPFNISFVTDPKHPDERKIDKDLADKLKSEASGILAWLVRGTLQWQIDGRLDYPSLVKEATGGKRREFDIVQDFIDECCVVGSEYRVNASVIYDVFSRWYEDNHSKSVPSINRFGRTMGKRFKVIKKGIKIYTGIGVLSNENS
jgi:putative DNA primase/helicase